MKKEKSSINVFQKYFADCSTSYIANIHNFCYCFYCLQITKIALQYCGICRNDIPTTDIAISMGCDVQCPFIIGGFDDDWVYLTQRGKVTMNIEK